MMIIFLSPSSIFPILGIKGVFDLGFHLGAKFLTEIHHEKIEAPSKESSSFHPHTHNISFMCLMSRESDIERKNFFPS